MARDVTVRVPDIGDFTDVVVIEVLVAPGARVEREGSLVTLESDKATMEVPSTHAGVVREVLVRVDDRVSEGTPLVRLEVADEAEAPAPRPAAAEKTAPAEKKPPAPAAAPAPPPSRPAAAPSDYDADVLVLGSGPGGYTAAFRAADLGKRVVLVERYPTLGGVCLNVGCIPSKALLHVAAVIESARDLAQHGVRFAAPELDFAGLLGFKNSVVKKLTGGLAQMAKLRGVKVVTGTGRFTDPHTLRVQTSDGDRPITFGHAIIAVGSQAAKLPGLPDDPRILDSTSALELDGKARRLLVIGGGIIGLEMAAVYHALGSEVTIVELLPELMAGADPDLVRPLKKRITSRYAGVHLATRVDEIEARSEGLHVSFAGEKAPAPAVFDRVLVAVGRTANGAKIDAQRAGVKVDAKGFIAADATQRTNVQHIFAIGDVTGPPLLAHRASHQGKVAAEVIAGLPAAFDAQVPSVAYTDPEVAWVGLTEERAKAEGVAYEKAQLPWAAIGRAVGIDRTEGFTKLLVAPDGRLLGAGVVGAGAGELIAELTLALELGADAEDVALTVHAHPTLSESIGFAAEVATGTVTDLYLPRRKPKKA
jgi:dihydrolipoamide dehydrogenase